MLEQPVCLLPQAMGVGQHEQEEGPIESSPGSAAGQGMWRAMLLQSAQVGAGRLHRQYRGCVEPVYA